MEMRIEYILNGSKRGLKLSAMKAAELSRESEREEDEDTIEDLHYTKSKPNREYIEDSITASCFGQKQMLKILDKQPARPGRWQY